MDYLTTYLKVMKNQDFVLSYIDAFAGSGWREAVVPFDARQQALWNGDGAASKGSALRVVDLGYEGRSFNRYVFGDKSRTNLVSLKSEIEAAFAGRERPDMEFHAMEADELIAAECHRLGPQDRAVMFLDPFGMQVSWRSIERIKDSGRIDLWYLAPTEAAIRLMNRDGSIPDDRRAKLDEAMGGRDWWDAVFRPRPADLFGEPGAMEREIGAEQIIQYFETKWRSLFGTGAARHGLRLGRAGRDTFLLCFACSNPSKSAQRPALSIANHLMSSARGG